MAKDGDRKDRTFKRLVTADVKGMSYSTSALSSLLIDSWRISITSTPRTARTCIFLDQKHVFVLRRWKTLLGDRKHSENICRKDTDLHKNFRQCCFYQTISYSYPHGKLGRSFVNTMDNTSLL